MTTTARRADPVPYPPVETARPACRSVDPELFFPLSGAPTVAPRAVCASCPVRVECLEYALAYDLHGVWGGTSYPERKAIRKARGIQALPVFFHDPAGGERRSKPRPRRAEVAFPQPAIQRGPAEADWAARAHADERPLSEYDPRQLRIVRFDLPVAELTAGPEAVAVSPAVAEEVPPASASSTTVRERSKTSRTVRRRPEASSDVREEPEPSEETAPERLAEATVDEAADEPPAAEEPVKCCPRCRDPKPYAEFYPSADTADGLSIWCKACFRAVRS